MSQSSVVLMAITVTVNKYTSSNVHAVHRSRSDTNQLLKHDIFRTRSTESSSRTSTSRSSSEFARRGLLLSAFISAYRYYPVTTSTTTDSRTQLLQKYLKKSEENKSKNDKERLDSYYKRNYKDYFDYVEGSLRGKKGQDLSESEKGILDWLTNNK